ncbi:MAG: capsular biosynthesis protein, partial [Akkermansia sp.]|nr:capsular biosynthesis protein [Akkermansia sp.]
MFRNLFTPRHTISSLFPDGMDMHTHILWGVDDGASSLQESLGIIRRL